MDFKGKCKDVGGEFVKTLGGNYCELDTRKQKNRTHIVQVADPNNTGDYIASILRLKKGYKGHIEDAFPEAELNFETYEVK